MDLDRAALKHPARTGRIWWVTAGAVPAAFLGLFFLYPLGSILERGLTDGGFRFPSDILFSHDTARIAWFTVWQAAASAALTLAAGMPLAWATARVRYRGRTLVRALVVVPFVLPTVVVATAMLALLPSRFERGVVPDPPRTRLLQRRRRRPRRRGVLEPSRSPALGRGGDPRRHTRPAVP